MSGPSLCALANAEVDSSAIDQASTVISCFMGKVLDCLRHA